MPSSLQRAEEEPAMCHSFRQRPAQGQGGRDVSLQVLLCIKCSHFLEGKDEINLTLKRRVCGNTGRGWGSKAGPRVLQIHHKGNIWQRKMCAGNLFDCNFNEKLKAYVHGIRLLSCGRSRFPLTNVNVLASPALPVSGHLRSVQQHQLLVPWHGRNLMLVARVVNLDFPLLKTEMGAKGDTCLADPTLMRGINKSKDFLFPSRVTFRLSQRDMICPGKWNSAGCRAGTLVYFPWALYVFIVVIHKRTLQGKRPCLWFAKNKCSVRNSNALEPKGSFHSVFAKNTRPVYRA